MILTPLNILHPTRKDVTFYETTINGGKEKITTSSDAVQMFLGKGYKIQNG